MQLRSTHPFDRTEIRHLLALEWSEIVKRSLAVPDGPALSISATAPAADEQGFSTHKRLVRLHLDRGALGGDLRCSLATLPFENECMQLVVARHAFDAGALDAGLHDELMRVLAPGGLLLVFGFNPLSSWRLWWLRQGLQGVHLPEWNTPAQMRRRLYCADRTSSRLDYLGGAWPTSDAMPGQIRSRPWYGVWLLGVRKQRAASHPIPLRARRKQVVLRPELAQLSPRRVRL